MADAHLPDAKMLRRLLDYDPETGVLRWKPRAPDLFAHTTNPDRICSSWNARLAGKEAFTADNGMGYRTGSIFNSDVFAHRVAWKWATGDEPEQIDHLNGIKSDNRLCNLRNVGYAENTKNQAMKRNNTSGVTGVRWDKARGKWFAYIRRDGAMQSLGRHDDRASAIAARLKAEREIGYHPGHGKRAALY